MMSGSSGGREIIGEAAHGDRGDHHDKSTGWKDTGPIGAGIPDHGGSHWLRSYRASSASLVG
jgi:hypothetical protein